MAQSNFFKDNQNLIIGGVVLYLGYTKIFISTLIIPAFISKLLIFLFLKV